MDKKIIHTRKRYLILVVIFLGLGLGLVFLPEKDNKKGIKPAELLVSLTDDSRFVSTDEVAERIINDDPSYLLIDVRSEEAYSKASLPGAINMPLDQILGEESMKLFGRKAYDKIIFSDSDIYADQAWVLLSRKMMSRTFILKGGVNEWISTIVNPVEPTEAAPSEDFELYNFRKGASRYFAGQSKAFEFDDNFIEKSSPKKSSAVKSKPKAKVALPPPPSEEEEEEEEGC